MRIVNPHSDSVALLYSSHHGWLHGWLRKKLGCTHHAADLAQDTFVRMLIRCDHQALREPRAYLTTIANGLLIDHWRRQELERAWLEALANQPEPITPSPEYRALILEALLQVDRMLESLSDKTRRAFLLAQIHGYTYKQIAVELKVSERMVKKYMAQAMLACIALDIAHD
nr:sigma-70 family RNA polymerase sigma factor [Janthinobacterium sp. Marseille]